MIYTSKVHRKNWQEEICQIKCLGKGKQHAEAGETSLTDPVEGSGQVLNILALYKIHSDSLKQSEIAMYRETGGMVSFCLSFFVKRYSLINSYMYVCRMYFGHTHPLTYLFSLPLLQPVPFLVSYTLFWEKKAYQLPMLSLTYISLDFILPDKHYIK